MTRDQPILSVRGLTTEFTTANGVLRAVDDVSFDLLPGEVLGVVGESGSGKSVTMLSALRLLAEPPARIVSGEVIFEGADILGLRRNQLQQLRGRRIGMVFQDPMTSLNPVLTIGQQIVEVILAHNEGASRRSARQRASELLRLVGVPEPETRLRQYPHEFSGGMRQRAMIAMAIANDPAVLIADEPTTALDVTIQAQVLDVLDKARRATGAATILITHDLGILAEMADRVIVMYAGRVVESGTVFEIFNTPAHPYTLGLLGARPGLAGEISRLASIPGSPPELTPLGAGCAFQPRCGLTRGRDICISTVPDLVATSGSHRSACHFHLEMAGSTPGSVD